MPSTISVGPPETNLQSPFLTPLDDGGWHSGGTIVAEEGDGGETRGTTGGGGGGADDGEGIPLNDSDDKDGLLASSSPVPGGLCLVASLAIPSMLSMIAEWWAAEFRQLLAGWLPAGESGVAEIMAANGVLFVTTVVWYQV